MQLTHFLTIAVLFAGSALAAPSADAHREKPAKPNHSTTTTTTNQSNSCGNGAAPYCCNTDNGGSGTSCSVSGSGSICSGTTVCCNSNNSAQVCLGNIGARLV